MDKTIETRFLEAFSFGGVVSKCIDWMRYTYQLNSPNKKPLNDKDKAFCKRLMGEILEATNAFDDSVLYGEDSPLMNEIEANLNECQTDAQKERYLFSLLKPFGLWGCDIASIYTPIAERNHLNKEIEYYANEMALWATNTKDNQAKEQIDACREMIKDRKERIEWVNHVNSRFVEITNGSGVEAKWMQEGTVESCLHAFVRVMKVFADRLDALLLINGIDLLALQNTSGLYLKRTRLTADVVPYIGSFELAQEYINRRHKEPRQEQVTQKQQQEVPIEIAHRKNRRKGRPKETFKDKMVDDADGCKLQRIHEVMRGKMGKGAALIIVACIKKGWIHSPTFTQVEREFGDIGTQQGFTKYLSESCHTKEEIDGAINSLN